LTLGFDASSTANRLGHVPDVLTTYVDRAGLLPGAVKVSAVHLKGYQHPPKTVIGELENVSPN
jgi:hypothetical protein